MTNESLRIDAIAPAEEAAALASWAGHIAETDRPLLERPEDAPDLTAWQLWVATRRGSPLAALRTLVQADRTATIRAPVLIEPTESNPDRTGDDGRALVTSVIGIFRGRGLRRAQALVATAEGPAAEFWRSCGFRHAAELISMLSLTAVRENASTAAELTFTPWSEERHDRFLRVVEQTYASSLDCRSVQTASAAEVLASYRAVGPFDSARWLLASDATGDVGCLLLADDPTGQQWEVVYLGVVPAARGRGLGQALVRHAQRLTAQAGRRRLTLAVDAANDKALDVYGATGFIECGRLNIFVCEF